MADNETHFQKRKRKFENNRVMTGVMLIVLALGAIGAALVGLKEIQDVLSKSWKAVSSIFVSDTTGTSEPIDTSRNVGPAEFQEPPSDPVADPHPAVTPPASTDNEGKTSSDKTDAAVRKIETLRSERQSLLAQRMMMAENCDEIIANKQALIDVETQLLNNNNTLQTATYRNELQSLKASANECN